VKAGILSFAQARLRPIPLKPFSHVFEKRHLPIVCLPGSQARINACLNLFGAFRRKRHLGKTWAGVDLCNKCLLPQGHIKL
jgi:hypothetical protein